MERGKLSCPETECWCQWDHRKFFFSPCTFSLSLPLCVSILACVCRSGSPNNHGRKKRGKRKTGAYKWQGTANCILKWMKWHVKYLPGNCRLVPIGALGNHLPHSSTSPVYWGRNWNFPATPVPSLSASLIWKWLCSFLEQASASLSDPLPQHKGEAEHLRQQLFCPAF